MFSVKMLEEIIATSYATGDKFYIDPAKLFPLARFLPQPKYVLLVVILILLHLGVFTVGWF
ncbi:putative H/ACA RNP complex subunit Gar1/Naf1, Cbf5-binding domain-containing protein [Helianthus anomalus]